MLSNVVMIGLAENFYRASARSTTLTEELRKTISDEIAGAANNYVFLQGTFSTEEVRDITTFAVHANGVAAVTAQTLLIMPDE